MNLAHKTITNSIASFLGFVSMTLSVLIVTPYTIQQLQADAYGIYILLFSTFGLISLIDVGFAYSSIRFIAEARVNNDIRKVITIVNMNLWAYVGIGISIVLLVIGGSHWIIQWLHVPDSLQFQAKIGLWLVVSTLPLYLAMNVYGAVIQAYQKYIFLNVVTIINAVVFTILTLIILYIQPSIINLMILNLLSGMMTLAGYIIVVKRLIPTYRLTFTFERDLFKQIMNFSTYTFIMIIVDRILVQADKFFVNNWLGAKAVTYYSVPSAVGVKLHGVMHTTNQVVFPLTAELDTQQRKQELITLYQQATKITWAALMVLALPVFIFSDSIIGFWIGVDYINPSGLLLKISMIGYGLFTLMSLPSALLAGLNLQKQSTLFHALAMITNLIALIVFIPRFGLAGAAWAFVVSQWPVIFMYRYCERKIGVPLRTQFILYIKFVVCCLILGFLLQFFIPWITTIWWLALILVLSVLSIAVVCYFVILNRDDRHIFLAYAQRYLPLKRSA